MKRYSVKKTTRNYTPIKGFSHLISIVESHGDRPLFKYPKGKEFITVSYREFANMCHHVAAGLDAVGLSGKRIAIIGDTSPEWVATYLATIAGGGVAVPMDKELAIMTTVGRRHDKPIALTETGLEGIPDSTWWTQTLLPIVSKYPLSYMLVWRNAREKVTHYYAPYPGQVSANDFVEFYRSSKTLFIGDDFELYK